jgi:hypothetical protein
MTYDKTDERATHDQDDDRDPVPGTTAVSVTRTDIPRQTEFRLVSPAPQPPSEDGPPEAIPALALPMEPGPAAPDDGQPAEPEDQPAITQPNPVLATPAHVEPAPAVADPRARAASAARDDDEPLLPGIEELRAGWQRARMAFVDNPRGAVAEAAGLADEAAEALATALRERRQRIRATWDGPTRDTEALRVALLRYQALFSRIVRD